MIRFSYTMLKDYIECPLKYKFRYLDKLKEFKQDRPYLSLGNCIHESLKNFFNIRDVKKRTLEKLIEIFNNSWIPKGFSSKDEEAEYKSNGLKMLIDFFNTADVFAQPLALEQKFELSFGKDIYLVGKIDRIDRLKDGIEVIDYKTTKYIPPEEEIKNDLQLTIYGIACLEIMNWMPKMLSFYYLPVNKKISIMKTPEELHETKEYITQKVNEMVSDTEFKPRSSYFCKYCDFLILCPLSGFGIKIGDIRDQTEYFKTSVRYLERLRNDFFDFLSASLELSSSIDVNDILNKACEKLKDLSKVEKTCIFVYQPWGISVGGNIGYIINPDNLQSLFDHLNQIINDTKKQAEYPLLLTDLSDTVYEKVFSGRGQISNLLIYLMILKEKFLGITCISNKRDKTTFSGFEIKYIQNFVTFVSTLLYNAYLYKEATTDGLTNLFNREYIISRVREELKRIKRYKTHQLSLLMLDIDHFKSINDIYGHLAGDSVLKQVAEILRNQLRDTDMAGRYGGEEFLIVLPYTDIKGAEIVAERIRALTESSKFQIDKKVTVSIGVAQCDPELQLEDLIKMADTALYQAKETGRNKVCIYNTKN